jgi:predicted nucleotidyltransferase
MIKKAGNHLDLVNIIASNGCIEILEPFLYKPKVEIYQSEVIKKTGIPKTRAIKLLKLLTEKGVLSETVIAGTNFYSISLENPVVKELKKLIIISKLYELTRDYSGENIEVDLFGSAARGEDTEDSDIDLLIVSDADKNTIYDIIDKIKNNVNREVNPVIYKSIEYANLYNTDKAFYNQIERYKIRVL